MKIDSHSRERLSIFFESPPIPLETFFCIFLKKVESLSFYNWVLESLNFYFN